MTISVVIPAYNSAATLPAAIESALYQTRPPEEIIVVDDGSNDTTKAVIERYGPRVRYICQSNSGPSAARNRGTKVASGDWIAYLDADDEWHADKLRLQELAVRSRPEVALVYTGGRSIGPNYAREYYIEAPRIWPRLRYGNFITPSAVMLRRQAWLEIGGFNEKLLGVEDWDLWVRLRSKYPFVGVAEPLTICKNTVGSLSSDPERMLRGMELMREETLLAGLPPWRKPIWNRRIHATQFMHAAEMVRQVSSARERRYLLRSLWEWPLPSLFPRRYLALLRNSIGMRRYRALSKAIFTRAG